MSEAKPSVYTAQLGSLAGVFFTLAATGVLAQGATPICAIEQSIACSPFAECERNLPGAFNIPALIKVDIDGSRITSFSGDGQQLTSEIASADETETAVILNGADNGHPWSAIIAKDTGRLSATVIMSDDTFIIFGECSWELTQ
jgi:hypothetical protein